MQLNTFACSACGRESPILGRRLRFVLGARMRVCAKCAAKKK